jgi:integrase/recombinase XerD
MTRKFTKPFRKTANSGKTKANLLATLLAIVLQNSEHKISAGRPIRKPNGPMTLHTVFGARKYLNTAERQRFATATETMPDEARLFCLLLMWSGCRVSEGLAVTPLAFDREAGTVALITLKRRKTGIVRQVPIPPMLIEELSEVFCLREREQDPHLCNLRLWRWNRSTGWRYVKEVMKRAAISGPAATPKGLRHTFGVAGFQSVPPHMVQRWLGHASLRTTAIYGDVSGREEYLLAKRVWENW